MNTAFNFFSILFNKHVNNIKYDEIVIDINFIDSFCFNEVF